MKRHVVEIADLTELAAARGSIRAVRLLRAGQLSRRTVAVKMIFEAATAQLADVELRQLLDRSISTLVAAARNRRVAADEVLLDPMVGAWTAEYLSRLYCPDGTVQAQDRDYDLSYLGGIAVVAALRAGITTDIDVLMRDAQLFLPGIGHIDFTRDQPAETRANFDSEWCHVRVRDGSAEISAPDGAMVRVDALGECGPDPDVSSSSSRWRVLRRVGSVVDGVMLDLRLEDCDPYRSLGSAGLHPGVDDDEFIQWRSMFNKAWALLVRHHPEQALAMGTALACVVPLAADQSQRSVTAEASFGAVRLTLPADATTLASTLVHEFQHTKLYALSHLVALSAADATQLHYVPWRAEPRPVEAVLQGVYAHLALIDFWYRHLMLGDTVPPLDPVFEFAWARESVRRTLVAVGNSGELTPVGEWFVAGMRRETERWEQVEVKRSVVRTVDERLTLHRGKWHLDHGSDDPL